jgi:hypothetical protein
MRGLMRRVVLVGSTVVTAVIVIAPAAHASGDTTVGGCSFASVPVKGSMMSTGVMTDTSVTLDGNGALTNAIVSCQIQVNGVAVPGDTHSYPGFGVQIGANAISFAAGVFDQVDLCQRVQYADGTDTGWECPIHGSEPPPALVDLVEDAMDNAFVDQLDPALCPVLVAHAGDYGAISIRPDGDVDVADPIGLGAAPVYDCPPYRYV